MSEYVNLVENGGKEILKSQSKLSQLRSKKINFILLILLSLFSVFIYRFWVDDRGHYEVTEYFLQTQSQLDRLIISNWTGWLRVRRKKNETSRSELSCKLPKLNPFDPSILSYIEALKPIKCDTKYKIYFSLDEDAEDGKSILIRKNLTTAKFNYCCYRQFWHENGTAMKQIMSENCTAIETERTEIPSGIEFIQIECQNQTGGMEIADLFGMFPLNPATLNRIEEFELKNKNMTGTGLERRVNVLLIGLDAVSHMNFIRQMPLSYDYLTNNLSALGMAGLTKVGDNTFPNIVPVLLGQTVKEMASSCSHEDGPYDNCPFIWQEYASRGYLTSFGEDASWIGTFTYNKKGFQIPPTDYYMLPLTDRLAKKMGHVRPMNSFVCYGPRLGLQVLLGYVKRMANTFKGKRKYFQFIWANSLTHDILNYGAFGDKDLFETLQWLQNGGHLEDTVLGLISDHGIRWGDIRDTLQGRIEERMPFLYFVLPEWFKIEYQGALANLIRNEARLTTAFDLHETLKDFLYLGNITDENLKTREKNLSDLVKTRSTAPRGISLFLPVPLTRTCKDAGIDDAWCLCKEMKPVQVENNGLVRAGALNIVQNINQMFEYFPQCSNLVLDQIFHAQVMQSGSINLTDMSQVIVDENDEKLETQPVTFSIALVVKPSGANFEGTVTRDTSGRWSLGGDISRTNLYGNQSDCVSDLKLKKFCFCSKSTLH